MLFKEKHFLNLADFFFDCSKPGSREEKDRFYRHPLTDMSNCGVSVMKALLLITLLYRLALPMVLKQMKRVTLDCVCMCELAVCTVYS